MYLHGETINSRDRRVSVEILTQGRRVPEIKLGVDDVYLDVGGVTIEGDISSLTDVVLARSATILLVSAKWLPELHASDYRDSVVIIKVEDEVVFAGHIQPQSYSQGFADFYDSYEINCIDALSAADLTRYRDVGSLDAPWDEVRAGAVSLSMGEIVAGIIADLSAPFEALGVECTTEWVSSRPLDTTGAELRDRGLLSELLFLGGDEDETWTRKRVLEEILRYMDLHIVQEGSVFRIFGWESVTDEEAVEVSTRIVADDRASISMGEVYNKITVAAEPTNVDTLLDAPFEEGDMTSPYSGRQLYCIEARLDTSKDDGTMQPDVKDYEAAEMIISGEDLPASIRWPGYTKREWTIRVMTHPGWKFRINGVSHVYLPSQNYVPDLLAQPTAYGAALIRWGYVERDLSGEDSAPGLLSESTSLVISVNGNGTDFPDEEALKSYHGCAVYTGQANAGNLSPSDDATTNYIVFSGKIVMVPRYKDCGYLSDNAEEFWASDCLREGHEGSTEHIRRSWWEATTPKAEPVRQNPAIFSGGLVPWEKLRDPLLPYDFGTVGSFADTIHKVDVVACMLVVGNKCVVEVASEGRPSDYEWRKFKPLAECADLDEYYAQSFSLGFNPKLGDGIVGQEYDIANNISYRDGLDVTGLAIPVRRGDKVSGPVSFSILGPVNLVWNKITYRHRTWFRKVKWSETDVPVMPLVANIQLSDLQVRVVSDNAMEQPLGDAEFIYTSDDGKRYSHPMDDVRMAITSALTEEERARMGVPATVSISCPIDVETDEGVTTIMRDGEKIKPEEAYVQAYYEAYSEPRVGMDLTVWEEYADGMGTYVHPALPGKIFRVLAISRDVMAGTATLKLREIW